MAKKKQIPQRIYGPHDIDDSKKGRSYCKYGCGCYWSRYGEKGGPIGLDPAISLCPNNLIKGKKLPSDQDHRMVVEDRINGLKEGIHIEVKSKARLYGILMVLHCKLLELGVPEKKIERLIKRAKPI